MSVTYIVGILARKSFITSGTDQNLKDKKFGIPFKALDSLSLWLWMIQKLSSIKISFLIKLDEKNYPKNVSKIGTQTLE